MTGLCRDCDFVHGDTRKGGNPWRYRCVKYPVVLEGPEELRFVDPDYRPDPPYRLCWAIMKDGGCNGSFSPRREAPKGDA